MSTEAAASAEREQRERRERRVQEAMHSGELDGFDVTPETRVDAEDYINGRIDSDELVARTRARYGLR